MLATVCLPVSSETASRSPLCPRHLISFQILGADTGHLPAVFTRTVIPASSFWVHVSSLSFSIVPWCDLTCHSLHDTLSFPLHLWWQIPHPQAPWWQALFCFAYHCALRVQHKASFWCLFLKELNEQKPPSHHKLPSCWSIHLCRAPPPSTLTCLLPLCLFVDTLQAIFSPVLFLRCFLNTDHFLSLYWICYNIASVFCFGFLVPRHVGS